MSYNVIFEGQRSSMCTFQNCSAEENHVGSHAFPFIYRFYVFKLLFY